MYGSLEEQVAILEYSRERSAYYIAAIAPLVGADNSAKVTRNLRQIMFPEERMSDVMYLKQSKELFEKLRNVNLSIMPVGGGYGRDRG